VDTDAQAQIVREPNGWEIERSEGILKPERAFRGGDDIRAHGRDCVAPRVPRQDCA
jgi:hypothetical protein